MFSAALLRHKFNALVNDRRLPTEVRSRIRQSTEEGAGRFQLIVPTRGADNELSNEAYLINFWHRYGLPQRLLQLPSSCCSAKCTTHGPGMPFDRDEFATGAHVLSCPHSAARFRRHQAVLGCSLDFLKSAYAARVSVDNVMVHVNDGSRIDATAAMVYSQKGACTVGVDATVSCVSVPSNVTAPSCQYSSAVNEAAERAKALKHEPHCRALGMEYTTFAMTTLGGLGASFRKRFVTPYFRKRSAEEKANGGTGFETVEEKRRFFERCSLAMARGNAEMVSAASVM